MTKEELIERLNDMATWAYLDGQPHMNADDYLLGYIGDAEIKAAFLKVKRQY